MKTRVLFNGSCPICSREISAYARYADNHGLPVGFEDLNITDMDAWGVTPDQAARRIHVMKDGKVYDGMSAFALVWDEMPRMRWLARIVRLPILKQILNAFYDFIMAPALYALHKRRERRPCSS